jgi:hypothetical protein
MSTLNTNNKHDIRVKFRDLLINDIQLPAQSFGGEDEVNRKKNLLNFQGKSEKELLRLMLDECTFHKCSESELYITLFPFFKLVMPDSALLTEDEFYNDFMPDVDRSEQEMISDALKGKTSKTNFNIDTSDSFAAISSIESLFSDSKKQPVKEAQKSSYFTLFGDAEKKAEENGSSPFDVFNF